MKRIILPMLVVVSVLTGCHDVGGGVRVEHSSPYAHNLPPAHAPAYGRRHQLHRYYYYPNAEFYFDIGRNMYFYLDSRGNWAVSATLPRHLYGYRNSYHVELEMESDRPYTEHHKHREKYHKQKHNKYDKKKGKPKGKGYRDYDDDNERMRLDNRHY